MHMGWAVKYLMLRPELLHLHVCIHHAYNCFRQMAHQYKPGKPLLSLILTVIVTQADKIATGHNADDIAETVLLNILRGDLPRLSRCAAIITGLYVVTIVTNDLLPVVLPLLVFLMKAHAVWDQVVAVWDRVLAVWDQGVARCKLANANSNAM